MWAVYIPRSLVSPLSIFSPDIVLRKPRVMSCRAFDVAIASHIDADATDQARPRVYKLKCPGTILLMAERSGERQGPACDGSFVWDIVYSQGRGREGQ